MRSNEAEAPRGIITELREALDAVPADEPRNYLRQSLQLLVVLSQFSLEGYLRYDLPP